MPDALPSFDTLRQLADQAPDKLEDLQRQLTQQAINEAPASCRPRLRGLQFRVDTTRRLAKTPLAACIRISAMMMDSFDEFTVTINEQASFDQSTPQQSDIIPFPKD